MIERIKVKKLKKLISSKEKAAKSIQNGMTIAIGGYTSSGYPKVVLNELIKLNEGTDNFKIKLISSANVGPIDTLLAEKNFISSRVPMIESKILSKQVNSNKVKYVEQQMHKMRNKINDNEFDNIDIAIVEALMIDDDGLLIPTSSVGYIDKILEVSKNIIIEINMSYSLNFYGMHDISEESFYNTKFKNIYNKFGRKGIKIDQDKITHIVRSDSLDLFPQPKENNQLMDCIAKNLINFLKKEEKKLGQLPPIQTGFGNLASTVIDYIGNANFKNLDLFCGGVTEEAIKHLHQNNINFINTSSIQITPYSLKILEDNEKTRDKIIIRNANVTNNPSYIYELGIISINTGIEVDIYGNVNSSHILGNSIVNGIGGGSSFAHNAKLSIIAIPSISKNGEISTIVPMVTHNDINEHDVDIIITENGIADLRNKSDVEKAFTIIENCSHDLYKNDLLEYFNEAISNFGGHHPISLNKVFFMHNRFIKNGTMRR